MGLFTRKPDPALLSPDAKLSLKEQIAKDKRMIDQLKAGLKSAQTSMEKIQATSPQIFNKIRVAEKRIDDTIALLQQGDAAYEDRKKLLALGNTLLPFAAIGAIIFLFGSTFLLNRWVDKRASREKDK